LGALAWKKIIIFLFSSENAIIKLIKLKKSMLTLEEKKKIIKKHNIHETDTGSGEVQIALLSEEINRLLSHLKKHKKDFLSKRGLLKMVAKRRKFLADLKKRDPKRYKELAGKIGLK